MEEFLKDLPTYLASIVRSVANWAAAYLVLHGAVDKSQENVVAGLIVGVAALGWSFLQKMQAKEKLKKAIAAPSGRAE